MTDGKQKLGEVFDFSESYNQLELVAADNRYEQLLDRRDKLNERTVFGLIALHAGSLAALLSIDWSKQLVTLSSKDVATMMSLNLAGIVAAGIAVFASAVHLTNVAGRAYVRLSYLRRVQSLLNTKATQVSVDHLGTQLDQAKEHMSRDFDDSKIRIVSFNLSGGLWLGAALVPLSHLIVLIWR